ncbi:MAG: ABC transporter substrate-binding protein [Clostridium sp.]|nr:ABC transporter substrate-binding protein [Clostridium sp.]MDU7083927.1 ABC transporter substrate-binding protein [Clostridium sp.]
MFKKVTALLLTVLLSAAILVGCGGSGNGKDQSNNTSGGDTKGETSETPKNREVTIGITGDAYSLDPYPRNETITNALNKHMFDCLVETDNELKTQPALAESWTTDENAKTWTFKLREGVKFHNGNDFTADDVIFSFDRANITEKSAFDYALATIESYTKKDDYTIEIVCYKPNALLLSHLKDVMILDKESCDGQTDEWIALNPIGTGRYKLLEHVREDKLVFERNDDFWGDLPEATKVTFKPISNEGTRTANILSGAVDLIDDVPVRDVEVLKANKDIEVLGNPSLRVMYINLAGWTDNPSPDAPMPLKAPDGSNPLKDVKVREALYRAIDEEQIVTQIMNGHATAAATYIPDNFNGYNGEVKRLEYDPVLAEKLLDEAGYPKQSDGYRFEMTLDASNDRYVNDGDIATAIAGFWEKIGIKVNLNLMSRTVFFTYIGTANKEGDKTHACMTGWADSGGESALMALDLLYSMKQEGPVKEGYGGVNRGYYLNPEVDALIDEAMATADYDERAKVMQKIWKIAADDVSYIPLHFQEDIYASSKKIKYNPRDDKYIYAWDIEFVD